MSLWRHRDFRRLWGGETISEFGSQISLVAVSLLAVRTLHATAWEVGVLTAAETLAFLLVGLPAGAWVDRMRRRPVMIAADLGRLAAMGSVPVAYWAGALTLAQLYVVVLVAGVLTVFFDVAYQSYLPALIGTEDLVEGNSKLQTTSSLAGIAGPSLAGVLVQALGGPSAIAIDAASFGASAAAVGALSHREGEPAPRTHSHLRHEVAEGLLFVVRHPILRAIAMTTAVSNLFGTISLSVTVYFLVHSLHLAPGIIGLVFAAGGVGGVIGATLAPPLSRWIGGARATILGILLSAAIILEPLATPSDGAVLFATASLFIGLGSVVYNVNQVSFRQRLCPPELLGRMNASMRFLVWGVMPIGGIVGGAIGAAWGARTALWVGAIGASTSVLCLIFSPLAGRRDYPELDVQADPG
jgi:MFS family permease